MPDLGRTLLVLGLVLAVAGALILLFGRFNLPFGRLPGDIRLGGRNWTFSFPIVSCLLLSVVLSFLLWIAGRFRH